MDKDGIFSARFTSMTLSECNVAGERRNLLILGKTRLRSSVVLLRLSPAAGYIPPLAIFGVESQSEAISMVRWEYSRRFRGTPEARMKTKPWILGSAGLAALIGAMTLTSVTSSASTPSSPAERAATAELNRNITLNNAAADEQYRLLEAQYQEQKRQNELAQQQYLAQLQSYQDNRDR